MKSTKAHHENRIKFGKVVRTLRESRRLSQERLAELAQCHRNYIGIVERGEQNISFDSMVRLAGALGVPVARIMREAGL